MIIKNYVLSKDLIGAPAPKLSQYNHNKTSRENKKILSLQFLAGTGIKNISCGATLLDASASTLTY